MSEVLYLDTSSLVHLLQVFTEIVQVVVARDDNGVGGIATDETRQTGEGLLARASNSDKQCMAAANKTNVTSWHTV